MSNSSPLVSVIMNCYNCERFLKEAIDSVYAQSVDDWEIIFWDNASADRSANIAKKYDARLKYHRAEVNAPLGEARNLAITKAVGKYIAFLDCDDLYTPDKLEKQLDLMEKKNYDLCYGGAALISEEGKLVRRLFPRNKSGDLLVAMLRKYEIHMPTVMLRRSTLINNHLSFNTELSYSPDYNLFMKFAATGPIGVVQDIIAKYRIHGGALSKKLLDRVSIEMKYTLDQINGSYKITNQEVVSAMKFAYSKLDYYDAISFISKDKYMEAKRCLKSVLWKSPKYLILYILVVFNLSKRTIFKLLRRE